VQRFTKLAFTQEFSVDIFSEYYAQRVKNVTEQHSIHAVKKIVAFGVQIFMKVTFSQRFYVQKRERSAFRI